MTAHFISQEKISTLLARVLTIGLEVLNLLHLRSSKSFIKEAFIHLPYRINTGRGSCRAERSLWWLLFRMPWNTCEKPLRVLPDDRPFRRSS